MKPDTILWFDSARGVYIPRDFANCFTDRAKNVSGVSAEDWTILEAGPDHEMYWETWDDVLSNAVVTDENGVKFTLHQDGDLWLIPEGMEWSDEAGTFQWPDDNVTVQDDGATDTITKSRAERGVELGILYWCDECTAYHIGGDHSWADVDTLEDVKCEKSEPS